MKVSPDFFDSNSGLFFVYQNGFRRLYQLQIDLEEAKGQEILKAIEEASVIVEETASIHLEDTQKIDKLSAEVEDLKHMIYEGMRSMAACNEFRHKKTTKAAHDVQANWHRHRDFKFYKRLMRSAIVTQTQWIGRIARKELCKLKAVKETNALQEAKDKLQAQVEDLNCRLKLEKQLKSDLEEAKGHEILKLQNSLQELKAKVDETNALLTQERESAQKAIEEASANAEETAPIHVEDVEKIEKLSAEVKELKSLLELERNRANESAKKCNEALESSEIKQQKLEETVNRVNQLQESMNRLGEKLTKIESENKVLRQQALTMGQSTKALVDLHSSSMQLRDADVEVEVKQQDLLIRCITQQLGFSKGRPVAACIIHKCLRQWRSFEVEKTNIFDRIIETIGQAIKTQANNDVLAYWLSNVSTLLLLFHTWKAHSLQQVEAKHPALLFKQQLAGFAEKIYGMIRDNLKKEISPLLGLCIQAQRLKGRVCASSQGTLMAHWQTIVNKIECFMNMFISNNVPPFLVGKIFMQMFSLIDVHLFHSVLLRRECCTWSYGEYVQAGLGKLAHWCYNSTEEYVGSAWDELKHIRQAVGFLVANQMRELTLDQVRCDLCPVLSIQQLHRISTMYWDDKYGTHCLSPDVISNIRVLKTEDSKNALSSSFLLDDDSSIPFSVDDLLKSMDQINIGDVEPPSLIRDDSGFSFLLPLAES